MVEGARYEIPGAWRPLDVPRAVLVNPASLWPPESRWDRVPMWQRAKGIQLRDELPGIQRGWGCTANGLWLALTELTVVIDDTALDLVQFVPPPAIRLPDH
jgi:hypothetical protein